MENKQAMLDPKVIVALDFDNSEEALNLVEQLDPTVCKLKVGKEMFTLFGPDFVRQLVSRNFDVFLDLKFHDIPNTVAKACKAAAELGVWMVNVHASGGSEMMKAAKQAIAQSNHPQTKLIAVTVLTSMDESQLQEIIPHTTPDQHVLHLASLAINAGLDGIVCSAMEAKQLRQNMPASFLLVTPGIRSADSPQGDQKRVMAPAEAVLAGASYLVMGRPVTQAASPVSVLQKVNTELNAL